MLHCGRNLGGIALSKEKKEELERSAEKLKEMIR